MLQGMCYIVLIFFVGAKPPETSEPRLSQQLQLDELWDALSICLVSLAKMPDSHAVLVLQPTVEAFFLVHAGRKTLYRNCVICLHFTGRFIVLFCSVFCNLIVIFHSLKYVSVDQYVHVRVSHFVESSFELLEFLLDKIFCDKIYRLICSTILAGISTR